MGELRRWLLPCLLLAGCSSSSTPASPDGGTDAGADGGPPEEAGVIADGGADAPSDGGREADASGPTWCDGLSPKPAFCDDFDRNDVATRWDAVVQTTGSALALDQASFRSAPQSLAVRSKNVLAGDFGNVLVRKSVSGTPTRAKLSFDVMADAVPTTGGPVAIATLDTSTSHLFTLYLRDDDAAPGPALVEQPPAGGPVRHTYALPSLAQWVRVELDVDLGTQKVSLRFDGNAALNQVAIAASTANGPTIRIGALTTGPQIPYSARFDNLTLEIQ